MKKFLYTHRAKIIDIAVVALIAAIFILWLLRITADMNSILAGPDEAMRYIIPKFIFTNGYLPTGYETAIHGNWSYAFYPQLLGAIISAGFMHITALFSHDPEWLVRAARLTSVLFGIIAALFVRRSARLLFETHKHKAVIGNLAMILFALLPQITFLSSYVNNDIIALAGISIIFYACLYVYKKGFSKAAAVWYAVGAVFAVLGYLNSYGFVLVGFIYLFVKLIQQYRTVKNKRNVVVYLLIMAGIPLLLCVPFLIRNIILYDGDIFGLRTFRSEYLSWVDETGIVLQFPYHEGIAMLIFGNRWIIETIRNFVIGYFGGFSGGLSNSYYRIYYAVAVIGFIGLVARLKGFKIDIERALFIGFMLLGSIITIALALYYTLEIDYQPQGRYIIYLGIPIILGITIGLVTFIQKFIKSAYVSRALVLAGLLYALLHLVIVYKTLF